MSSNATASAKHFGVLTAFAVKTRRKGGILRERALRSAERAIAQLGSDYETWLAKDIDELCSIIIEDIFSRQSERSQDQTTFDRAYRKAAEIAEMGSTFDYALVTRIAGELCQILSKVNRIDDREKRMINCHIDALRLVGNPKYKGMQADEVPKLLDGLRKISERLINDAEFRIVDD